MAEKLSYKQKEIVRRVYKDFEREAINKNGLPQLTIIFIPPDRIHVQKIPGLSKDLLIKYGELLIESTKEDKTVTPSIPAQPYFSRLKKWLWTKLNLRRI